MKNETIPLVKEAPLAFIVVNPSIHCTPLVGFAKQSEKKKMNNKNQFGNIKRCLSFSP
jgi:hypothetical protein